MKRLLRSRLFQGTVAVLAGAGLAGGATYVMIWAASPFTVHFASGVSL